MGRQLGRFSGLLVLFVVAGCSGGDDAKDAYLNAPEGTKKISKVQAGLDRGMTPDQVAAIDESSTHGRGKR